ncbi:MAG: ATPase [Fibrobacteria bacterium]|nr:ATPase [Fibrobacteria bacterium]
MLDRSQFGVETLDSMLGGGLVAGSANIVEGAPGTGKTTLGMQFIVNGIEKYHEPGLIVTFEEFPSQYYHDALNFGWDLKKYEEKGMLKIIFTNPDVVLDEIDEMGGKIESLIDELGIKRCLIDSLTHFEYEVDDENELREMEFDFISSLKRESLTSILLRENNNLLGQTSSLSQAPFIADSYIILRYVEIESAVSKAMLILKMRGSQHAKDIRRFQITEGGFEISEKFIGQDGILSGSPMPSAADAFMKAFVKAG